MSVETDNPFEKVLDRLREKGWMQGRFGGPNGPNCIYGAAGNVGVSNDIEAVLDVIETQFPDRMKDKASYHHPGPHFNDHPDTTFTDVERVLEKAAVKWEEERVMRNE